jgi:CRP-like cAMP-binding protein
MLRTSTPTTATYLAQIPLFSACTEKQLAKVARLFDEVTVPAGKVLVEQGAVAFDFYVIVSGAVDVAVDGVAVANLIDGQYFGELAPLDKQPRSATVTATTETRLLVMTPRAFSTAVATVPGLAAKLLAGLSARVREANSLLVAA